MATVPARARGMAAGGWPAILAIYLFAVAAGATVSKLIPLSADFAAAFGMNGATFGWLVSVMAIPAAVLAIPSGLVVDRYGARAVLIGAAVVAAAANLLSWSAQATGVLAAARLLEGAAIVHIYTAGPALMMTMTEGRRRTTALSVWTTYMPVGTALALACSGAVAGTPYWRTAFAAHGGLFLLAAVIGLGLPRETAGSTGPRRTLASQLAGLRSAYARPSLLALSAAFFLVISLGLGANVALPQHLSAMLGLSMGSASSLVAGTTLIMVPGSLLTGMAIARGMRPTAFFLGLAVIGCMLGIVCFMPHVTLGMRSIALAGWFLASGASTACVMAVLPLVAEPERRGAATALLNQTAALATFVNPPLWLGFAGSGDWTPFAVLMVVGWSGAALTLWAATRVRVAPHQTS